MTAVTLRRLILLTNRYPYDGGDSTFIESEIDALVRGFDDVVVFNFDTSGENPVVSVPQGVRFGGNLADRGRFGKLISALAPSRLCRALRLINWKQSLPGVRLDILAAVLGAGIAGDPRLRRLLRDPNTQASVYAFWGMGAGLSLPWLRANGRALIVRVHRYDLYASSRNPLPLRDALYAAADRILPVSEDGAEYLRRNVPAVGSKVTVSRLGTANYGVGPMPAPGDEVTVVSCSSVIPVKRVDRIYDAVLELAARGHSVRWIHFGDGELRPSLEKRVAARPSLVHVELRGAVPHHHVMEHFSTHGAHVFVNTSESEGVPVSIMEALSFGIPVVATDVGGTHEIVGASLGSGLLVGADATTTELAHTIETVVATRESFRPRETWRKLCDAATLSAKTTALILDSRSAR